MASISAVLARLAPVDAERFKVVFVTTDPERDTPERIDEWLGSFNRQFIGLTGPLEQVNEIQQAIGLGASYREDLPTGGYGIAHAAQVLAYTTDNLARVVYPFGTRQADWAHDLPLLAQMD
jgi:protein SCO1/2